MSKSNLAMISYICAALGSYLLAPHIMPKKGLVKLAELTNKWSKLIDSLIESLKFHINRSYSKIKNTFSRKVSKAESRILFLLSCLYPVIFIIFFNSYLPYKISIQILLAVLYEILICISIYSLKKSKNSNNIYLKIFFGILSIPGYILISLPSLILYVVVASIIESIIIASTIYLIFFLFLGYIILRAQKLLADFSVKTKPEKLLGYVGLLMLVAGFVFLYISNQYPPLNN